MLLFADSLTPSLRARWSGRVATGAAAERIRTARGVGTLLTVRGVRRVGPFAQIGVDIHDAGPFPYRYYTSSRVLLMELNGEWLTVNVTSRYDAQQ